MKDEHPAAEPNLAALAHELTRLRMTKMLLEAKSKENDELVAKACDCYAKSIEVTNRIYEKITLERNMIQLQVDSVRTAMARLM